MTQKSHDAEEGQLPHSLVADATALKRATAFLKLLAHEGRLEIMCMLLDGGKTVGEIGRDMNLGQSTVSQQLMRLRAEGLVVANRKGRHIQYALGRPEVHTVIRALQEAFCPPGNFGP